MDLSAAEGLQAKMHSKIIKESLKESFLAISNKKKLFLLIFILQIVFFFLIAAISINYFTKIIENSKNILDYSEKLNLDSAKMQLDVLQQKNFLGEDPLLISRNYDKLIKNFGIFLFYIFISFSLVNGFLWYCASNIHAKKLFLIKNSFRYLLKFLVVSIFLFLISILFFYSLLEITFSGFLNANPKTFIPLLLLTAILLYFIYISIPLINSFKLKELPKKAFFIGTKRVFIVLISYLITLISIALSLFLVFYFLELSGLLLFISLILMIFVFVFNKVYFSIVIKKLSRL